jgi:hypothetical protein
MMRWLWHVSEETVTYGCTVLKVTEKCARLSCAPCITPFAHPPARPPTRAPCTKSKFRLYAQVQLVSKDSVRAHQEDSRANLVVGRASACPTAAVSLPPCLQIYHRELFKFSIFLIFLHA